MPPGHREHSTQEKIRCCRLHLIRRASLTISMPSKRKNGAISFPSDVIRKWDRPLATIFTIPPKRIQQPTFKLQKFLGQHFRGLLLSARPLIRLVGEQPMAHATSRMNTANGASRV